MPGHETRTSTDRGHIHISARSDSDNDDRADSYDPLEDRMTNLGYSDDDGKFLCERVNALLHLNPAVMGPEKGKSYPVVELLKRLERTLDGLAARPAPAVDVTALAAALAPLLADALDVELDAAAVLGVLESAEGQAALVQAANRAEDE